MLLLGDAVCWPSSERSQNRLWKPGCLGRARGATSSRGWAASPWHGWCTVSFDGDHGLQRQQEESTGDTADAPFIHRVPKLGGLFLATRNS